MAPPTFVHRFRTKRTGYSEVGIAADGNKTYINDRGEPVHTEPSDEFSREIAKLALRLAALEEAGASTEIDGLGT